MTENEGGAPDSCSTPVPLPATARGVLSALEQLLADERKALVRLDRDAIEAFATRKLELDAALRERCQLTPLELGDRQLLERVRHAALENQLLLSHARSCVQGMLSLLAPHNAPGYSAPGHGSAGSAHPPPMALNLRG
jgi:flagellar biosynthesis/type III secretory pathway chaperone